MKPLQSVGNEEIDYEWMMLILEAKNLGLQKEEIREFLGVFEEK